MEEAAPPLSCLISSLAMPDTRLPNSRPSSDGIYSRDKLSCACVDVNPGLRCAAGLLPASPVLPQCAPGHHYRKEKKSHEHCRMKTRKPFGFPWEIYSRWKGEHRRWKKEEKPRRLPPHPAARYRYRGKGPSLISAKAEVHLALPGQVVLLGATSAQAGIRRR